MGVCQKWTPRLSGFGSKAPYRTLSELSWGQIFQPGLAAHLTDPEGRCALDGYFFYV